MLIRPFQSQVAVSSNSATGSAPSSLTDGSNLLGARGYVVTVSADTGHVLTGTGSMLCYWMNPALQRWCRNPDLDFPITPTGATWTNMQDRVAAEFDMVVGVGQMKWVPSGVGTDGGSNVTTTQHVAAEF